MAKGDNTAPAGTVEAAAGPAAVNSVFTFTIPPGVGGRIVAAFTTVYGTQPQYAGLQGAQLVIAVIVEFIRSTLAAAEGNAAGDTARRNAANQARTDSAGITGSGG